MNGCFPYRVIKKYFHYLFFFFILQNAHCVWIKYDVKEYDLNDVKWCEQQAIKSYCVLNKKSSVRCKMFWENVTHQNGCFFSDVYPFNVCCHVFFLRIISSVTQRHSLKYPFWITIRFRYAKFRYLHAKKHLLLRYKSLIYIVMLRNICLKIAI